MRTPLNQPPPLRPCFLGVAGVRVYKMLALSSLLYAFLLVLLKNFNALKNHKLDYKKNFVACIHGDGVGVVQE